MRQDIAPFPVASGGRQGFLFIGQYRILSNKAYQNFINGV